MPGGESVGNAYLNVVPKIDGDANSLGSSFGNKFSSGAKSAFSAGAVALGNILSNVITSAASAVGDQFADAFWNYADYEQLVGGVDTLFKDASSVVQENAKNAFKTAGMSANEYMENVTSFSASLISSLDGDTTKAADIANKAMVDMSDNANKMGTDMEAITNAYQGFAKQNYTMLDNLKLGYGGTKGEMERLLADASEIAGVKFNIDSYADVIEAIHVMQESMDIAGTTMTEGSTTISGSISQLKGAWTNFLTALGDGGQTIDMDAAITNLMDSIGAVASNVLPALERMGASIAANLPTIMTKAFSGLSGIVRNAITSAFGNDAGAMFDSVMQSLSTSANTAFDAVSTAIADLTPVFSELFEHVSSVLPGIMEIFSDVSGNIQSLVETVWPDVKAIVTEAVEAIGSVIEVVWPVVQSIITTASDAIYGIVQVVWPAVSAVIQGAVSNIKGIINGLKPILNTVKTVFDGVRNAIKQPIEAAKKAVQSAIDKISSIINGAHLELPHFKLPHFNINGGQLPWGIGGKGTPPSISVSWYAKGGFASGAQLIGVGERGTEFIWPEYSPYFDKYANALAERIDGGGITINLNYEAGTEPNEMLLDISRGIRQLRAAGAI